MLNVHMAQKIFENYKILTKSATRHIENVVMLEERVRKLRVNTVWFFFSRNEEFNM